MPKDLGANCDPARLARLARLDLDDRERALFTDQLRLMILTFNRIGELPTADVEPLALSGNPPLTVREDEASPGSDSGGDFLAVPALFDKPAGGKR